MQLGRPHHKQHKDHKVLDSAIMVQASRLRQGLPKVEVQARCLHLNGNVLIATI